MAKHTIGELKQIQSLSLRSKVEMTRTRIKGWVNEYGEDGVVVSFSGGKDSTVLLHIVREMYPDVPAMFVNTGLEYPEIVKFVKTHENVDIIRPRLNFRQIIERYGYPFISKEVSGIVGGGQRAKKQLEQEGYDISDRTVMVEECAKRLKKQRGEWRRLAQCLGAISKTNEIKPDLSSDEKGMYSDIPQKYKFLMNAPFFVSDRCCMEMKKNPAHQYQKETGRRAITAQMADESRLRLNQWLAHGCNMFDVKNPVSNPMSFWTEQDVLRYIKENNIKIASVYGDIVNVDSDGMEYPYTFCEMPLKTTGMRRTGCMFCGYGCQFDKAGEGRFELMKQTHPKIYDYIMRPSEQGGLNYKKIIDWINENGSLSIRY